MPVMTKDKHNKLKRQLLNRWDELMFQFTARELKSPKEGSSKGHWMHPETMCSTVGSKVDISLAIADFKTILAEIGKLK